MTTRRPSNVTDAPAAAQAATPGAGEAARYAPAADLPDAATVARMANAFYTTPPSAPVPGPGAALPSAPVFAAEPMYNSLPGVPALQLPLAPNLNPGLPPMPIPASGAAQPSAPIFAIEPMVGLAQGSRRASCSRKAERAGALRRSCPRCRPRRRRYRSAVRPRHPQRREAFPATPTSRHFPIRWAA